MKKLMNFILILVVLICVFKISYKMYRYSEEKQEYEEYAMEKEIIIEEKKEGQQIENTLYREFHNKNEDYIGWIKVDGTNIDYPIVQGKDNEFYLQRDFEREKSISGSIFLDYRNDFYKDKNNIIYGHNMKNKTMFNNLTKFKTKEFYENNRFIKIYTKDKEEVYEVFSVYIVDGREENIKYKFENEKDYKDYIKEIRGKSLFQRKGGVFEEGEIITLITCSYELEEGRVVVYGGKI